MASDATIPLRTVGGDSNIVYLLRGETLTVGTNAILTINPGVVIKFYDASLSVRRGLHAIGGATPDSQIVFTSYRDDFYGGDTNQDSSASSPAMGDLDYIQFEDQALDPECTMRHCVVRYASYGSYGAIHCVNASPTVTDSRISDNYYGVYASGNSNPVLTGNDFFNNSQYGVYNAGASFCIDATDCWWGDNSGPLDNSNVLDVCGGLYNPTGTGNRVTDNVDYSGWRVQSGNPIMGDVSLNGTVHAYDATLVLLYVANPVANPLIPLQQMVAEVSGNGTITGYDASLILQYVAGLIDVFPAELDNTENPGIRPTLPEIATVDGQLSMADLRASVGEEISMPVSVGFTGSLYSAQFTVSYDPSMLQFVEIEPSIALNGFLIQSSDNGGELRVVVAGTYPVASSGDIMQLKFQVADDVHGKVMTNLILSDAMLNETEPTLSSGSGSVSILGLPTDYSLGQNYPNPFNPVTTIPYALPEADQVSIAIYNIQGQLVRTLIDGRQEAGNHVVVWNGNGSDGIPMASGIYFVRMKAGDYLKVYKMTLLK
jgi:parallel beta-helix repeat protein